INIDEATTQGVELSTTLPLGAFFAQAEGWTLSANYTYTDSELKSRDGKRNQQLADTPEHLFNARLSWAVNDQLTTWLSTEYRGESRRFNEHPDDLTGNNARIYAAVGDISAYNLWNLGATYQIAENVRLNAAVYNLFDLDFRGGWKAYEDTNGDTQYAHEYSHQTRSTRGGVQEGRRYWISATYDF
ncbi:TonB-dependent receptor domain-containing protein, partial [Marinospirillum sp.]|uniref:TonB-dependent receptor domain-containing protein n=1 Tax=Marinospirillum sp. TaxID=2183934 RepID=UPI003A8C558E